MELERFAILPQEPLDFPTKPICALTDTIKTKDVRRIAQRGCRMPN